MFVELINYTPDPEITVVTAARTCYKSESDSKDHKLGHRDAKLLKNLIKKGHHSILEHISFTFRISGVSRALTHQLVRHRIASYSQKSQRYVREDGFEYITPDTIKTSKYHRRYEALMKEIDNFYNEMINDKIPAEDARYILPNACCSEIVVTMNARAWLHFLELREENNAQWEIRKLAKQIHLKLQNIAPTIFK
ncbi:MAG: FAD-dependent thymidylate synthase [Candidatus Hydrogenedentota bacterium]